MRLTSIKHLNQINNHPERGAALLLYVLFMTLLAAAGAYGFYAAQKNLDEISPVTAEVNRAQSAAFMGIEAIQQDAESQLVSCTTSVSSSNCGPSSAPVSAAATSIIAGTAVTISAWQIANPLGPTGNPEWIYESVGSTSGGVVQKLQAIIDEQSTQPGKNQDTYALQTNGNLVVNQGLSINGGVGVNGNVSINAASTVNGNLDAHNITINNSNSQIGNIDYTNSLTVAQAGNRLGQINYGNTASAPNFTYDPSTPPASSQLSSSQTTQLNNQLNAVPAINPQAYQTYAGVQLLVNGGVPEVTISPFMANVDGDLISGSGLPISCTYNSSSSQSYAQQCPGQYDMQILAGATSATVNPYSSNFAYSGGTWTSNNNLAVPGFYYIQGSLTIDTAVGSSDNPVALSVVTTGSFIANQTYFTTPFALSDAACNAQNAANDPVCTAQGVPVPMAAGVSVVTGGNLTLDSASSLGGDALSTGTILFNQQATVGGIIVADNQNNATSGVTFNQMTITNKNEYAQAATGGPPPPPPAFVIQSMAWGT
ncbi:protein of unknown function [Acidithiobacillus ferrivorans]|uniref:Uncharacterized protein n=2 Tax=Acidithiobacillus ferrivorans TaxID=160808 RepID=A0A060UZR4_9PROT|nr:exported hypothetical protein [Acidithiobacillus ferrivorans]SMH64729.1 protein of unknown function [Acidithiobacillus ferrivorans]